MRSTLRSKFALEVFTSGSNLEKRLPEFLALYVQHSPAQHRTKTNQLIDFLERPEEGRELYYFGLTYDGEPCGFAVLMFYPAHLVGMFDHVVVKPTVRGYGAFFALADLITGFLETQRISFDYLLAEVLLGDGSTGMPVDPSLMIRLSRLIGFRALTLAYHAPDPEIVTRRKDCRAALMVYSQPDRDMISSAEALRVLRVVYFDHYFNWHVRYLPSNQVRAYKGALEKELEVVGKNVATTDQIKLNGGKNLDLIFSVAPGRGETINQIGYAWFLAVPTILTIVVGLAQAPQLTLLSIVVGSLLVGSALFHEGFRRRVIDFFRLGK